MKVANKFDEHRQVKQEEERKEERKKEKRNDVKRQRWNRTFYILKTSFIHFKFSSGQRTHWSMCMCVNFVMIEQSIVLLFIS